MSIFYCNYLSISPLFLYDTTINFWFPPLIYHDPSYSKQTMKHSFPMSLPKYSFWNYFSLNPSPNIIYPWCRAWHCTKSGWAPPPPPSYITHPGILPPRSSCCPIQHSIESGWACHGSRAQRRDRRVPPRTRRSGCRPTPSRDAPLPPLTLVQLWVSRSCLQNQGKAVYNIITLRSYSVLICLNLWFYLRVSRNCALKKIRKKAPKFNPLVLRVWGSYSGEIIIILWPPHHLFDKEFVWLKTFDLHKISLNKSLTYNLWPTPDLLDKGFVLLPVFLLLGFLLQEIQEFLPVVRTGRRLTRLVLHSLTRGQQGILGKQRMDQRFQIPY